MASSNTSASTHRDLHRPDAPFIDIAWGPAPGLRQNGVVTVLHDLLAERGTLLIDGAMGTELFARGLGSGDPPEMWNVDHPDRVIAVHADYIEAGSDIVLTNSFGGTGFRLKLHKLDDRCIELNRSAARVARAATDAHFEATGHRVLVAGSMGPSGELLVPMGTMTPATCADAFREQAIGLAEGGAEILWIETMSHLDEIAAAVEGARSVSDLPICTTLSFDTAGRTMMGVTGADAVNRLAEVGVTAVGANCGNNLADTEAALVEMRAANPDILLISKANAGMPEWHGTELHYSGSPDVMAAHAIRQRDAGVQIIGACCGSAPRHLHMMRQVLDGVIPVPEVEFEVATVRQVSKGRVRTGRRAARPPA
jgi:methionine synthase I (cobalamin-dependent)